MSLLRRKSWAVGSFLWWSAPCPKLRKHCVFRWTGRLQRRDIWRLRAAACLWRPRNGLRAQPGSPVLSSMACSMRRKFCPSSRSRKSTSSGITTPVSSTTTRPCPAAGAAPEKSTQKAPRKNTWTFSPSPTTATPLQAGRPAPSMPTAAASVPAGLRESELQSQRQPPTLPPYSALR